MQCHITVKKLKPVNQYTKILIDSWTLQGNWKKFKETLIDIIFNRPVIFLLERYDKALGNDSFFAKAFRYKADFTDIKDREGSFISKTDF